MLKKERENYKKSCKKFGAVKSEDQKIKIPKVQKLKIPKIKSKKVVNSKKSRLNYQRSEEFQ